MNSNRPVAKPMCKRRRSAGFNPCKVQKSQCVPPSQWVHHCTSNSSPQNQLRCSSYKQRPCVPTERSLYTVRSPLQSVAPRVVCCVLNFGRQMSLCNPSNPIPQLVGQLNLVKEVSKHGCFIGLIAIHRRLRDGKEHIVFHSNLTVQYVHTLIEQESMSVLNRFLI